MSSSEQNSTAKTPAEIELEDTLRSIRGVGESADGATAAESSDEPDEPVS